MKKKPTKIKLIPPDPKRCQTEERPGGPHSFMTFGPIPPLRRCEEKPVCIATEINTSKKDGQKGSMSLCGRHLAVMLETNGPDFAAVKEIK